MNKYPNWKAVSFHLHLRCNWFKTTGWLQDRLILSPVLGRKKLFRKNFLVKVPLKHVPRSSLEEVIKFLKCLKTMRLCSFAVHLPYLLYL